jgi:hypothetical protein
VDDAVAPFGRKMWMRVNRQSKPPCLGCSEMRLRQEGPVCLDNSSSGSDRHEYSDAFISSDVCSRVDKAVFAVRILPESGRLWTSSASEEQKSLQSLYSFGVSANFCGDRQEDALEFGGRPMGAPPARGKDILHVNKQRPRLDIHLDRLTNLIIRSWRRILLTFGSLQLGCHIICDFGPS